MLTILKSKTFWAAVIAAAGYLLQAPHIGITEILYALGLVLGAAGVRDAFLKSAPINSIDGAKRAAEITAIRQASLPEYRTSKLPDLDT